MTQSDRDNTKDHFWVIGGGLLQVPLIDEVRKLGLNVIVSDRNADCVCSTLADRFVEVDIFDVEGHIRYAENLRDAGLKIIGVLAAGIDAPETMAVLSMHLGLPSVDPAIARLVNHKGRFREWLQTAGFPVPRFRIIDTNSLQILEQMVAEIGFPLIVKNTDSSGSRGTRIFYEADLEGVREAVGLAMAVSRSKKALLEEFWDGPEQTVETLFDINGVFHPCFITDRIFDKKNGFAMEIGLRHPSTLPNSIQREMFAIAEDVARSLGIKIGAAKYDMILTKDGPRIIEMTVRLSGGFDSQYLVPAATGKNVLRAAIHTALGQQFPIDLLEDRKQKVGLSQSLWPEPGTIVAIEGEREARSVEGCEHIFFRYHVGERILPYDDCTKRFCFVIVTGETEKAAASSFEKVKNLIRVKTE